MGFLFSHIKEWEDTPSSPLQKQNGKIQGLGYLAGVDDGQDVFLGLLGEKWSQLWTPFVSR